VTALVFAPDGRSLFSASGGEGSRDNTIRLWALPDGREIRKFVGHRSGIFCLALAPDGKRIASAGNGGEIRIWDVATGQEAASFSAGPRRVLTLVFAPDGQSLASAGHDHIVHLWDPVTGKELHTFAGHTNDIRTVLFTPDGKNLISGGTDHTVRLWNVATGKEIRQFGQEHQARGQGTAISPDGKVLVSGDGEVYRWELSSGRQLGDRLGGLLRTDVSGQFLAFSPDGSKLAVQGWSGWIFLWDMQKDREIHKLRGPYGIYNNLAFSPDGKLLAAGGYGNTIRFWETATGKEIKESGGSQGPITWLSFARGDKSLVAASKDRARVWDLGDGKEPLAALGRHGETLIQGDTYALSADGRTLAVSRWNEKVRFVDVASGEVADRSPRDPDNSCTAFMPNAQQVFLVDRDGQTVILWSRVAGREVRRFVGHLAPIWAVAVSADGRYLATASATPNPFRGKPPPQDDSIRLWDVATGRERWRLPTTSWTLAFSSDGALLAGGGRNNAIHLWETATGKEVKQFETPQSYNSRVKFSPDGKSLASTARDGTVRLWEVLTGQERARFVGHRGEVYALAISTDGRRLASGGDDTSVLLWDVGGLLTTKQAQTERANEHDLTSRWRDLGSSQADKAYDSIWRLVGAGNSAVNSLKTQLRPVQEIKPEIISRWIKDLNSEQFSVRERAERALENASDMAEPALLDAKKQPPSLEVGRRIERLLAGIRENQSPERLRGLRAAEVLANIGTPEARGFLKELAGGVPEAGITRESKAALERLERRDAPPPWSPRSYRPTPDEERLLHPPETGRKDSYGGVLPSRAVVRLGAIDPAKKTLLLGLSFSPDGKSVMIGDGTSVVRLWDKAKGIPIREFRVNSGALDEATLSPDGKLLAAATRQGNQELFWALWDVASGREIRRVAASDAVSALCFSPDSKQLAIGMDDRKAHLWDLATGKELRTFAGTEEGIWGLAISPDSKLLAVGERGAIRAWDITTGQLLWRLGSGAFSLAFSPNGLFLATGENGGICFWEAATG
jgi:WD40 repeat protein